MLNYKEYYFFNQNLLTEQERYILNNKLCGSLSYNVERIRNDFLDSVCQYCKNIFILYNGDYVICSECKNIKNFEV